MSDFQDNLMKYTDHSLSYGDLVGNLRAFVEEENADADVVGGLADYIEENLSTQQLAEAGQDALLPGLAMLLHGMLGARNLKAHKTIIKKLVDKL